jgi:hypothetical protein
METPRMMMSAKGIKIKKSGDMEFEGLRAFLEQRR